MAAGFRSCGDDAEIDGVRRVPDQDLGLLLGRAAIHRLILPEAGEPGGGGPDRLVELAVDLDGALQPGNLRGWRALPPATAAPEPGLEEQQEREQVRWVKVESGRGTGRKENSDRKIYGKVKHRVSRFLREVFTS